MEIKIIGKNLDLLGEGPTYNKNQNNIYWVDIDDKKYHYVNLSNLNKISTINVLGPISSIVSTTNFYMAATIFHDFYLLDDIGNPKKLISIEERNPETRFNDGKVDPFGAYVAGTMDKNKKNQIASLYRFDGKKIIKILNNLRISNGLAWDTDKHIFYHIDTPDRNVKAYLYDNNMNLDYLGVAVDFNKELGNPDGMTIDSEGHLWIAHYGGSQISVWDPKNHKKITSIKFPAANITSCTFAGDNLNYLFVTSAKNRNQFDLGGSLFLLKTDIQGYLPFKFKIS